MQINLLFRSISITKVLSTTCLLILFFSAMHIVTIINIFNSQARNHQSITQLTELNHQLDIFYLRAKHSKIDKKVAFSGLAQLLQLPQTKHRIFNVDDITNANRNLINEYLLLRERVTYLSNKRLQRRVNHLSDLVTLSISNYQKLLKKEAYFINAAEVITFLLIACCSLFLLIYSRNHITKPLKTLRRNVNSIKHHNFNIKFPAYHNEVGHLCTGMQGMSSELESLILSMQNKVDDQTAELENANKTIQFLYTISQQLSTVKLTPTIIREALNALAKQTKLTRICLEFNDGTQIESDYGCANQHTAKKRIPIIINGKPLAYLNYVTSVDLAENASIIASFGSLLSRALYQEEFSLQEQKLLLMEERGIIARELHDSIAQALTFLKIQCTVLGRQIESNDDNESSQQTLNNIKEAVSDAYVQLRSLLSTFRLNISESDFKEAIMIMIAQLQKQTTAQIQIGEFEPNFKTHANQHIHLLQIIREAVTNAMKHANCNNITINCVISNNNVNITICDDGIGIDANPEKANHYGLEIMSQRASELDGELHIQNLSVGTEIRLVFPI